MKLYKIFAIIILITTCLFVLFWRMDKSKIISSTCNVQGMNNNEMIDEINKYRAMESLEPLKVESALIISAGEKAEHMIKYDYFDHDSPWGDEPWKFFKSVEYNYGRAGENLARGFCSEKEVVDAWMRSEKHREIIMDGDYKDFGMNTAGSYVVGHFGTLHESKY